MKRQFLLHAIVALVFVGAGNASYAEDAPGTKYRYTVAWDYWCDNSNPRSFGNWNGMDVRLNGKSIGIRYEAFKRLEELPVKEGEHVKLEMPARRQGYSPLPGHTFSGFLQRWMAKSVLADWYEGGARLPVHTVTYTDFKGPEGLVRYWDSVTWIVDGRRIGKGDALLKLIEKWKGSKRLVIQILCPLNWNSEYSIESPGDGLDPMRALGLLDNKKSIRVFWITPEEYEDVPPRVLEKVSEGKPRGLKSRQTEM
jgi:hypothetical protein